MVTLLQHDQSLGTPILIEKHLTSGLLSILSTVQQVGPLLQFFVHFMYTFGVFELKVLLV